MLARAGEGDRTITTKMVSPSNFVHELILIVPPHSPNICLPANGKEARQADVDLVFFLPYLLASTCSFTSSFSRHLSHRLVVIVVIMSNVIRTVRHLGR